LPSEFYYEFKTLPDRIFLKEISTMVEFHLTGISNSVKSNTLDLQIKSEDDNYVKPDGLLFLDYDKISAGSSFVIRTKKPADRFRPLGCPYSVQLKKYFIDKKIPQSDRLKTPLLFVDDLLVCLIGYQIADQVKVTSNTKVALKILTYPRCC